MEKGNYGYLSGKRKLSLLKSALLLAAVFVIYFAALHHFHTNRNIFSLVAAAGALPAGRSIVVSVLCLRARGASEKAHRQICEVKGLLPGASGYDLYLTAYENAYSLSHAAVHAGKLIGLTEAPGMDCRQCEMHISSMLEKDGLSGYQVRVFTDLPSYLRELEEFAGPEDQQESAREDRKAMQTLYAVSL